MSTLLLLVFGLYFLCMLALLYGWEQMVRRKIRHGHAHLAISVLVPVRNEQTNLAPLIKSLSNQRYPTEKLQIIFVNDHSTDETGNILTSLPPNFIVLNLTETAGKKAAISLGMKHATGEIVVTTDADCTHHADWLQTINDYFRDSTIQLLVGPVAIKTTNFFSGLQAMEFASLIGSAAALLSWSKPTMANGANLAFRRHAFLSVNGYEGNDHIASGDDEFLLRKIHKKFPNDIAFNSNPSAVVLTEPQPTLAAFVQQRLRWASKWKHNSSWLTKLIAVFVFLFQVSIVVLLIAVSTCPNRALQIIVLLKFTIDGIFLWRVASFLKIKFSFFTFIIVQLAYPIYVIVIALLSQVVPYQWKDRISNGQ